MSLLLLGRLHKACWKGEKRRFSCWISAQDWWQIIVSTHHHSVTTRSEQPTTSFTRSLPDLRFDSFTQTILIEDICAVNTHVHTFNNLVWTWMGDIKLPNKWWSVFCRSSIIVIRAYLALSNFKTTVKQFTVARCIVCYLVLLGSLSSLHSPENGEWCGEERRGGIQADTRQGPGH